MSNQRVAGSTKARRIRIGVLLAILFGVLCYAWLDVRSRARRNEWENTLDVAVVVLRRGRVDDAAIDSLRARLPALEQRLYAEMQRHRPRGPRPFSFHLRGPLDVSVGAPLPQGMGIWDLARHTYRLWRYTRAIDAAAGVERGYASRIYITIKPPDGNGASSVEGTSEPNGRVGMVDVELDGTMVDFALFVVAHELFHTLGATDKYDAAGRAKVPDGLADPARVPLYPQDQAELMARNRPIGGGREKPPMKLDELAVGDATAREIGWIKGPKAAN